MKTTKQIKEELEKGCGERLGYCKIICSEKDGLCDDCDLKLQQHNETLKARNKEIENKINKELKYWQTAYPEQKELLKKFATKIKLEIDLIGDENEKTTT